MIPPSLVLAFVLASLYGLAFYIVLGRGWQRLGVFWLVGLVGFALGEWLGSAVGFGLLRVGELNVLEGTLASWTSLFVAWAIQR